MVIFNFQVIMILKDLKYFWLYVLDRIWEENGGILFLLEQEVNRDFSIVKEYYIWVG